MPVPYAYDMKTQTLMARPEGEIGLADIYDYFSRVVEDESFAEATTECVNFDLVKDFTFSYSETSALRILCEQMYTEKSIKRTVFVVPWVSVSMRAISIVNKALRELFP